MRRGGLHLITASITLILTTGCGVSDVADDPRTPPRDGDIAAAEAHMRRLPSLEDSERELRTIRDEILAATREIAPTLDWQPYRTSGFTSLGCTPTYSAANGTSFELEQARSAVPIADPDWPRVLETARDIAARAGLTRAVAIRDTAGNHDVELKNTGNGDTIRLATREAALVTAVTGCRFTAATLAGDTDR